MSDSKTEAIVFCNLIAEMAFVILAIFYSLEASHTMGFVLTKGIPAGGGHLRNLPATHRKPLEVSEQEMTWPDVPCQRITLAFLSIRSMSGGWAREDTGRPVGTSVKDDASRD